jgi:DnaJ family protein C protein 9
MNHIPHSTTTDEPRFITLIESLITSKELERLPKWTKTSKDENSKKRRKKEEMSEAVEAEEHAKTLGIWDEMFGEGSTGSGSKKRKSTGKEKDGDDGKKSKKRKEESGEDDDAGMAGLKAMIAKRQGARQSAMDAILDKYSKPAAAKSSGKKSKR